MNNVFNIPLDLIDTAPQVRTQFKESSIAELAESIRDHGTLQPLVVTKNGGRYTLTIGERRLRALRYLGEATAPACISTLNEDQAREAQLMENIQREDLNAKDLASAVMAMYQIHGTIAAVAMRCSKSTSWVSKRMQLAKEIGPITAELLDIVKDIELLYTFAKLEQLDKIAARLIANEIKQGIAGRAEVNAALANAMNPDQGDKEPDTDQPDLTGMDTGEGAPTGKQTADVAYMLKIAMDALTEIKQSQVASPHSKKMRNIAVAALARLETV